MPFCPRGVCSPLWVMNCADKNVLLDREARKWHGYLRKSSPDQGHSQYKGPVVGGLWLGGT